MKIDLANFASPDAIALSGRPKGEEIRRRLNLTSKDTAPDQIEVKVPHNIVSLNSSFFLGLFAPSIQVLGEKRFREKYLFEARAEVFNDINQGIEQALNKANPLKHN